MSDKLLTITEAAEMLKVHPETLRRWDRDGSLVAVKVNDRGDRRYYLDDIVKLVKYRQPITYKNHEIIWDSEGFVSMQGDFGVIAKIIVKYGNKHTGFAFASPGLQELTRTNKEKPLDDFAMKQIIGLIDSDKLLDEDVHTFEFINNDFYEVENPDWWNGKYVRALLDGLLIKVSHTAPTTVENKAWRVILRFQCKQGDIWVTNTFGPNHEYVEYFVWVDSKELLNRKLPNTPKGAEALAMQYGIDRFNETKDENGNRDITRITENNAACFNGNCHKGQLLPEDY